MILSGLDLAFDYLNSDLSPEDIFKQCFPMIGSSGVEVRLVSLKGGLLEATAP